MSKAIKLVALAAVGAILTGCTTASMLKTWSAGQTGCVPDAIEVSTPTAVIGGVMWNATCNGKKYLCTSLGSPRESAQNSCALAQ